MKPDAESHWLLDAKIAASAELDLKNQELATRASGLDRDLAALRAGSDMNGSSFGASIQAKLDATKAARQRTEVLQASRGKIIADASHANRLAVDNALDAARSDIPKSDLATRAKSIDQTVGKYYLSERIEVEFRRADSIESRIKTEGGQYQTDRLLIATDGRHALNLAQRNLDLGLLERSHTALRLGARLLDVALDFSPLIVAAAAPQATLAIGVAMSVAFAKDYYEARTGHRLISGEVLAAADRAMALTAVVLDVVPLVGPSFRALASASDCLDIFTDMMKSAQAEGRVASASAAEVAELSEAVQGVERVLESTKRIGLDNAQQAKQLATTIQKSGVKAERVTETLEAIGKSPAMSSAVRNTPIGKPMFYVKTTGEAFPSTGYRHFASNDNIVHKIVENDGIVPAYGNGNYVTFNKIDDAATASSKLQVVHDAAIRMEFDTLHVVDDLRVPKGNWDTADWLEPITKDHPEYGLGGATQAVTNSAIRVNEIVNLKTGEILYKRR